VKEAESVKKGSPVPTYQIDPTRIDSLMVKEVAERFRKGQVGVVPTETVYGLAALMTLAPSVSRLYQIKGREGTKPCAVAIADPSEVEGLAAEVSEAARWLMEVFWPGPLTLVFRAREHLPAHVMRGGVTVGVRCPDQAFLTAVIRALGWPLLLTSANLSGQPSVFTPEKIEVEGVDFLVNGGETALRRESTVVDVTQDPPRILRKGVLDEERLFQFGVFS